MPHRKTRGNKKGRKRKIPLRTKSQAPDLQEVIPLILLHPLLPFTPFLQLPIEPTKQHPPLFPASFNPAAAPSQPLQVLYPRAHHPHHNKIPTNITTFRTTTSKPLVPSICPLKQVHIPIFEKK